MMKVGGRARYLSSRHDRISRGPEPKGNILHIFQINYTFNTLCVWHSPPPSPPHPTPQARHVSVAQYFFSLFRAPRFAQAQFNHYSTFGTALLQLGAEKLGSQSTLEDWV